MKICVCGKGGSGKSTIVALLADGFKRHGKNVVVLDSDDSNTSLFWMLGFDSAPRPLMDLVGGKKNVQKKMLARFASGEEEPTMTIWEMEKLPVHEIPTDYIIGNEDLKLVSTGKIHQAMEGCACPMGTVTRQESDVVGKLNDLDVPIMGTVGRHDEFQSACLEGTPLDCSIASAEMENVVRSLLEHAGKISTP